MFHLPLINGRIRPGDVAWRLRAGQIHFIRGQMHRSSLPCAKGLPLAHFYSMAYPLATPPGRQGMRRLPLKHTKGPSLGALLHLFPVQA